jgi:hypothetical protein
METNSNENFRTDVFSVLEKLINFAIFPKIWYLTRFRRRAHLRRSCASQVVECSRKQKYGFDAVCNVKTLI